jgi:hypothetical protein
VQAIRTLRQRLGVTGGHPRRQARTGLAPDEWWCANLARTVAIPKHTLEHWIQRRWVTARQEATGWRRWIVWADPAEQERLRRPHQRPIAADIRQQWLERKAVPDAPPA